VNIVDDIIDFFVRLFRSRVDSVRISAKTKVMGAQARVQGKVANTFNRAIDAPIDKAKNKMRDVRRPK